MFHHSRLVRRSNAQASQSPFDFARARLCHAAHELINISHLKRDVNGVEIERVECRVVDARRERVHDGRTDESHDFGLAVQFVNAINVA